MIKSSELFLGLSPDGFHVLKDADGYCPTIIEHCYECSDAKQTTDEVAREQAVGEAQTDKEARSRDTQPDGWHGRDPCC
jgi:hypothetical protein